MYGFLSIVCPSQSIRSEDLERANARHESSETREKIPPSTSLTVLESKYFFENNGLILLPATAPIAVMSPKKKKKLAPFLIGPSRPNFLGITSIEKK